MRAGPSATGYVGDYWTAATSEVFTQENLERAFGGVLRNFQLGGRALHDDDDVRQVTVLTDDERPLVFYGDKTRQRSDEPPK